MQQLLQPFSFWILQNLLAIDQLCNTLFCGGYCDETMSSNAYRMNIQGKPWGFLRYVIDFIFSPIMKDHCQKAFESERLRLQAPPEER